MEHGCEPKIALKRANLYKFLETAEWCEKYIASKELNNKLESALSKNLNNNKMKV